MTGEASIETTDSPSWLRIAGVVALGIVVAVVVWLIVKNDRKRGGRSPVPATPEAVTPETIRGLPQQLGHPVYWAGRKPDFTYELTQVDGNIFIRYLPAGTGVGDPRPNFLTVGTYPKPSSYPVLQRQARLRENSHRSLPGRGIAVWSDRRPQSVYLAYRGFDIRVEVYAPSAARARRLATSGAVKPIR